MQAQQLAQRGEHSEFEPLIPKSNSYLKRSNAVRIKTQTLGLLPNQIRQAVLALKLKELKRARGSPQEESPPIGSGLFEQIRQGVSLRPVEAELGLANHADVTAGPINQSTGLQESVTTQLIKVLKCRYLAVQQTDDERSDTSSISSCNDLSD